MPNPKVEVLQMNPAFTNSVLVSVGSECVIFDAWGTVGDWDRVLADSGFTLRAIFSTHGHYDHISAAPGLAEKYNVPWYLNHNDLFMIPWCNDALKQMVMAPIPDNYKHPLHLGRGRIDILGMECRVIETPGHSAGGVAFLFNDQNLLIIGDTLFQDTVGRYDLPGADSDALRGSIALVYDMDFPDNMTVIHGHGPDSTIGELKRNNPYFNTQVTRMYL